VRSAKGGPKGNKLKRTRASTRRGERTRCKYTRRGGTAYYEMERGAKDAEDYSNEPNNHTSSSAGGSIMPEHQGPVSCPRSKNGLLKVLRGGLVRQSSRHGRKGGGSFRLNRKTCELKLDDFPGGKTSRLCRDTPNRIRRAWRTLRVGSVPVFGQNVSGPRRDDLSR